jgi:hypothetical protein
VGVSNATVAAELGRYRVTWQEPHVIFDFDLLRSERSSEVTAEVTVQAWDEAAAVMRHVHQARVNLTGTRSREDLGRKLKSAANGAADLDWPALVEGSSVLVLREYRRGEPAIRLRDAEQPTGAAELIPPLVLRRQPTIWFGDGGTGKSYLALAAAATIHTGNADLLGIEPTETTRVAYLDFELEAWEQRERLVRLVGDDLPDIIYRRCVGPLRDQVDSLRRLVRDEHIGFVVIDSVAWACAGPPEDSDVARGFFEGVRMLDVGALCIAHVNRAGDTQKPFGSGFWHNGARSTWYVRKEQEVAADRLTVGLFNRKANLGPLARPIGFELRFTADRVTIARTDLADIPALALHLPLKQRIAHEVRDGALTMADVAERLEVPVDSVKKTFQRNEGSLFVRVTGDDGIYRVGLLRRAAA